ncbi:MAG: putative 4-mercaptohistidine N1-methyltransferase [Opitutales bacterium]|jgi:putative 4-mercaptohistidine N1-methyltranferase|nr:putative 4-mercaptohistidine N1-methyltransferase [Opitutales bacterium]MDG2254400.1 putative 4-mercaptohistidine N1-methyltransferase [Opitutaceae bacterium]
METSFYETNKAVSEYLLFHYGKPDDIFLNGVGSTEALDFPSRCGELHQGFKLNRSRALDLGCAVGGAAFAMSQSFEEVVGIDFSHALIESAQRMASESEIAIPIAVEGELTRDIPVSLPPKTQPDRVHFEQGDAMNLAPQLGRFDFILMANLIDRLPDPASCLSRIHDSVSKNGIIAITSPYTWLEEYTPKENWLGGYLRDGYPIRTQDTLVELLDNRFELLDSRNLPFLIREHERKNQYSIAQATIWRKR